MASRVALLLSLLLVAFFILPNQASGKKVSESLVVHQQGNLQYGFREGTLHPQECSPRCTYRCSKTAFKKPCLFFCNKCCTTCLCVPPGTYGNKQVCPCYNNWKTKSGGPKCP